MSMTSKHPRFNRTNDNIEWAQWTWNPVTGCLHGCAYCYARDIATRFSDGDFSPQFHPHRLEAPANTPLPKDNTPGSRNVFVCSMADLFGQWVPDEWIQSVLGKVADSPDWRFLFLTKNPHRLTQYEFPDNAGVGATVDVQSRAEETINALSDVVAPVRFISCEPLLEEITFPTLSFIDWLIVGACSRTSRQQELQPKWEWVEGLLTQAREGRTMVYFKPNLTVKPKEYPR